VSQNRGSPFQIAVLLHSPVGRSVGITELPAQHCVGSLRYSSSSAGAHRFAMSWQQGDCLGGTMTLQRVDANTLRYSWKGVYADGAPASSTATLKRLDRLSFLGPASSRYPGGYAAQVIGARRTAAGRVALSFEASGSRDLRRPERSCLVHATTGEQAPVRATHLREDSPGRFAGELEFVLFRAGIWQFVYSCASDYTRADAVRVG
jgi:hypothetical protein